MHAKLSRRMTKLHRRFGPINNQLLKFLNKAGNNAFNFRYEQWESIQKCQAQLIHWAPDTLDFEKDTILSLTNSRSQIDRILTDESEGIAPPLFQPQEPRRYASPDHTNVDFGAGNGVKRLRKAIAANAVLALADFEETVQTHLENWVSQRNHSDNTAPCASLAKYFQVYSDAASKLYELNVEEWSIMLLTLFELWMAIDRLAIAQLPSLRDYDPEVSPALIEPLLLRTFKSTQRGICIMNYCRMRAKRAMRGSVFSDVSSENSFGVRYFRASPHLQRIESNIVQTAQSERSATIRDLLTKRKLYEDLMLKAGEHPFRLPS